MKTFLKYLGIQFRMDVRDRGTLMTFYLTPLVFFFVMGAVFSSINPQMKATLAATMTIFAVTMGAVMGSPAPIVKMRESGTLRAFRVNGISGTVVLSVHAVSAFLHLLVVSAVIYFVSPLAFGADVPRRPAVYFGVLAAYLFASIGVGLLIGVVSRGQSFATMLSMLVFLPSLLLSGIMFPSSMLPRTLGWIGRVFPATYALEAFDGLAYRMATGLDPALSVCIVAATGLLMFALAIGWLGRLRRDERS